MSEQDTIIRVLVVDDHSAMRAGLTQLLSNAPDIEVVGEAEDGAVAVERAHDLQPDVVLMDLVMPGMDGIEATRQIMSEQPGLHVVVLTTFSDRERILAAIDAGAIGYLLKDADPDELVRGIRAAARGASPLDPQVGRTLLAARAEREAATHVLTDRETEVLKLIGQGLPNKQIALRLGISDKTVKAHVTRILQSLGVTDRTQAALWAQRNGII